MWSDMICLRRPYHFNLSKSCLPQILLANGLEYLDPLVLHVQLCGQSLQLNVMLNHFDHG